MARVEVERGDCTAAVAVFGRSEQISSSIRKVVSATGSCIVVTSPSGKLVVTIALRVRAIDRSLE